MTLEDRDIAYCAETIRHGSKSFHAASHLLPASVRNPALVLYAFCRQADDAVDLNADKSDAVHVLWDRLNDIYQGRPRNAPEDRAFATIVEEFDMPRALPEALLEGFAWDALERQYPTISDLRAYAARVASAVGAMMCVLMRVRDRNALSRACDLGVAMQLTNIARDVGEDAQEGRLYLPVTWLEDAGVDAAELVQSPRPSPELGHVVRRLLVEADGLYRRSEAGIPALPLNCRMGIFAARHIYAGIGGVVRRAGYDPISDRARTRGWQKLGWLSLSAIQGVASAGLPTSPLLFARPLPETAFLVDAAADPILRRDWSDTLYDTLAQAKAYDLKQRSTLIRDRAGANMRA